MTIPQFPQGPCRLDPEPVPSALTRCMVCGQGNPHGFHARFHRLLGADGTVIGVGAEVRPPAHFEGFDNVLHGGAICALLDDAMWWAVYTAHAAQTVTADMHLVFKRPTAMDARLRVEGIAGPGPRIFATAARLLNGDGQVVAEATGRFVRPPSGAPGAARASA